MGSRDLQVAPAVFRYDLDTQPKGYGYRDTMIDRKEPKLRRHPDCARLAARRGIYKVFDARLFF